MSEWDYTNERVLFRMDLNGDFEWVCSAITSQNIYGHAPTIILLMRPSRLFVKIRCHAVPSSRKRSAVRNDQGSGSWQVCHEFEPVPLKTRRVGQPCTLNLSRAETSSHWCGVVVRRGGGSSGVVHVTGPWFKITWSVAKSPRAAVQCDVNIHSLTHSGHSFFQREMWSRQPSDYGHEVVAGMSRVSSPGATEDSPGREELVRVKSDEAHYVPPL
ncbi:uncharacterized protein TNCV_900181 [Trichonephila clavipes]|nr:uncharacterized protein TNCV_900181 [Trichonephila clavipes]